MYLALGGRPNFGWFSVDLRWWSYYSANYLIYIIFCSDNNSNEITRTIHTSTIRLVQELWLCFNTDIICLGQGVVNISRVTQQELFESLQSATASCPDNTAVTYLREMEVLQCLVGKFYLAAILSVLLYGLESWVWLLFAFAYHRAWLSSPCLLLWKVSTIILLVY